MKNLRHLFYCIIKLKSFGFFAVRFLSDSRLQTIPYRAFFLPGSRNLGIARPNNVRMFYVAAERDKANNTDINQ